MHSSEILREIYAAQERLRQADEALPGLRKSESALETVRGRLQTMSCQIDQDLQQRSGRLDKAGLDRTRVRTFGGLTDEQLAKVQEGMKMQSEVMDMIREIQDATSNAQKSIRQNMRGSDNERSFLSQLYRALEQAQQAEAAGI